MIVLVSASLAACSTSLRGTSPAPSGARPSSSAGAAAGSSSVGAVAPQRPTSAWRAPEGYGAAGPAYVLVDLVGVLRIDGGKVSTALPITDDVDIWTNLVVGPGGELWVSDWKHGGRVLALAGGAPRDVWAARKETSYDKLAVRSPTDAWAITNGLGEWVLTHHDGTRWAEVRRRAQFAGRFDDNKLIALALTPDSVWVSTMNGLWQGTAANWQRIDSPPGGYEHPSLIFTYRNRLLADYQSGYFLRDDGDWRKLDWPVDAGRLRAVSDSGLAAGVSPDGRQVVLGTLDGDGQAVTSSAVRGANVGAITIDQSDRVWVATDRALSVLDRSGRLVAEWALGTLPGLTGRIGEIAVVGGGPTQLPAPQAGRTWEVVGRMRLAKFDAPLANATLNLCPRFDSKDRCKDDPFAPSTTTDASGSFRFNDVPEGDFYLHVTPPAGEQHCRSPYTRVGRSLTPAHDCKASRGTPRRCDLGVLEECRPFEMPPPILAPQGGKRRSKTKGGGAP